MENACFKSKMNAIINLCTPATSGHFILQHISNILQHISNIWQKGKTSTFAKFQHQKNCNNTTGGCDD